MVTPRKANETDEEYVARLAVEALSPSMDEDVWHLQRDDGESDEAYEFRCAALGCDANGYRKLRRWKP
jgi:hypothetical protein